MVEFIELFRYYIKWGFESRLKPLLDSQCQSLHYIKWGFESRLKPLLVAKCADIDYIKWGFESRLKLRGWL